MDEGSLSRNGGRRWRRPGRERPLPDTSRPRLAPWVERSIALESRAAVVARKRRPSPEPGRAKLAPTLGPACRREAVSSCRDRRPSQVVGRGEREPPGTRRRPRLRKSGRRRSRPASTPPGPVAGTPFGGLHDSRPRSATGCGRRPHLRAGGWNRMPARPTPRICPGIPTFSSRASGVRRAVEVPPDRSAPAPGHRHPAGQPRRRR